MESLNYQLFTIFLTQVVNAIINSKSTIASVFQSVREVSIHICISNKRGQMKNLVNHLVLIQTGISMDIVRGDIFQFCVTYLNKHFRILDGRA